MATQAGQSPCKALDRAKKNGQTRTMPGNDIKLEIWTEGLGEFYGIAPDQRERRERQPMSIAEMQLLLGKILDENEPSDTKALFIIKRGNQTAHLSLVANKLELSDPAHVNYQNVPVSLDDLPAALLDFFNLRKPEEQVRKSHLMLLEWVIAVIVGLGMVAAFVFVADYLEEKDGFLPEPEYTAIDNQAEFTGHLSRLAGIYLTELSNNETLLALHPDGRWGFYDLERGAGRLFNAVVVESGLCRPVLHKGRLALLTDANYLLIPDSSGILVFQGRTYIRTGETEDDLPFVNFPE